MRSDQPTGSLAVALAHGHRLLEKSPALAEAQALAILEAAPASDEARLLIFHARLRKGELGTARAVLEQLSAARPDWGEALGPAWRVLGDQLSLAGDNRGADEADARAIRASVNDPELIRAAQALCDEELPIAERILRDRLKRAPTDAPAIRMLSEVAARLGRYSDAEVLLERCLELAPGFREARHNYACVLNRLNKAVELNREADLLLQAEPANPGFRILKAAALGRIGEFDAAIALYEDILQAAPNHAKIWLSLGHALKSAGRTDACIAAYDRAIALQPGFGEAWWSLANLKTYRFAPERIDAMRAVLCRDDLSDEDRLHLEYTLGKALEDEGAWADSFAHYAAGASIRRRQIAYDRADLSGLVARSQALFTPEFFAERSGLGCEAADPIFVVGLPRSGSTLIEQILATHSAVEGTQELAEITAMARALGVRRRSDQGPAYPEVLAELDGDKLKALGEDFLERTRIQRKTARPFFIDKMPNNFAHVGLIHLILPNAKIIDARRHPMAVGFSAFKQHFAAGQHYSYDLEELGLYYRDYVELMAQFDAALPGRVHRVVYEQMVEDTEAEVRRLLDYCGLPFEPECLRFYENDRAVRTASAEQVRRPIFRDAVEHWRNYEPWLEPLKAALGPVLQTYPEAPTTAGA